MVEPATVPYLEVVVGFILLVNLLHTYLDIRQLRAIKKPSPPPALQGLFSQDLYKQSQSYAIDKWWLGLFRGLFGLAETLAILYFRVLPWLWGAIPGWIPALQGYGEIPHTVAFVLLLSLVSTLTSLPWSLYSTFVVEERHGFNKQTLGMFLADTVKGLLLGLVLVPPIVAGFTYLLQRAGPWVPLYLWGFVLSLSLVMMTIYPVLIAPLFNKFENLAEGSLRSKIEALAGALKFPLKKLYSMDGSKRSAHSNAYMYGFFNNKRIVLFDTLINQCSEEQVVAVLAHELGHWKLRHTPFSFLMGQVIILLQFLLFTAMRNSGDLYSSFGFDKDTRPAFIAFVLFQYVVSPVDEVISCLQNVISRRFEFQADGFAVSLGHGSELRQALLKLEETNKASMNVDPWYSAYHYSHPPLEERLEAIDNALKKGE